MCHVLFRGVILTVLSSSESGGFVSKDIGSMESVRLSRNFFGEGGRRGGGRKFHPDRNCILNRGSTALRPLEYWHTVSNCIKEIDKVSFVCVCVSKTADTFTHKPIVCPGSDVTRNKRCCVLNETLGPEVLYALENHKVCIR